MSKEISPIIWSGLIHIENRKVLTLKENDKPFYMIPGGKRERSEDSEDRLETDKETVEREVREELGVGVANLRFFDVITDTSKATGQLIEFRLYTGTITEAPDINNLPNKTEHVVFLDSCYEQEGFEVGHLPARLLPLLTNKDMIN